MQPDPEATLRGEDPLADPELAAYSKWADTLEEWAESGPVVSAGSVGDLEFVRLESVTTDDPLVWAQRRADQFDAETFAPVPVSALEGFEPVGYDAQRWKNLLAWYGDTVDDALDQGDWLGQTPVRDEVLLPE